MVITKIRISLHILLLSILLSLTHASLQAPDLITELRDSSGRWSLYLLLISLLFTPVTRFRPKYRIYIPLRRIVGLWGFVYAAVHLLVWISLEFDFAWQKMSEEILGNLFICLGLISFALLSLLALTSNRWSQRYKGYAHWRQLHTLSYPAIALGLAHYFMAQKLLEWQPLLLIGLFLMLSLWRWRYAD